MIWDVHAHLHGVDGRTPEERMANIVRFMDRMGVERVCVSMGFPHVMDPSPEQLRAQNDYATRAIAHHHDRAFGFVYCSGKYPTESVREIERCVKNGPMVGVKLWVAQLARDRRLDAIISAATELKAPILQHTWFKATGNHPGESTPLDLVELARRHPTAKLICGHSGGDWERGFAALRGAPTVVAEVGGFDPAAGCVEMGVRELGADRILYGSDDGGRSFGGQLAKVQGADIPADAKRKILGENLRALLRPILADKGMKP